MAAGSTSYRVYTSLLYRDGDQKGITSFAQDAPPMDVEGRDFDSPKNFDAFFNFCKNVFNDLCSLIYGL